MLSLLRLIAVLTAVGWVGWRAFPRWLRAASVATFAVAFVMATPLGANALVRLQESRIGTAEVCTVPSSAIVVLASGVRAAPADPEDFATLDEASLHRLFAALALYKRRPMPLVIVGTSGYEIADSRVLASLASALGVGAGDLRVETASLTTWENAQALAKLDPPVPRRIALVTSPVHMARALYAFRAAGFEPCAHPSRSDYQGFDGIGYLLPVESAAIKAEAVLHEWAGEIAYRMRFGR
jgi:uncharacterized SAM-binding protein YcdF (DUF218 family)